MVNQQEKFTQYEDDATSHYPSDVLDALKEMIAGHGNVHIHGAKGSGKSELLRILAANLTDQKNIIFVPQEYDFCRRHENLPNVKFFPPGLDPWTILIKKEPDVVIVDGDESLRAKNGKQFPSGEPIDDEFLPYQHEHTLWDMTNKHIQVLSAGEHSVYEMNEHLKEYGMGAYGMNYDLDVEIKKALKDDGTLWFSLDVKDVKHLRTRKVEGMKSMLQLISKKRS